MVNLHHIGSWAPSFFKDVRSAHLNPRIKIFVFIHVLVSIVGMFSAFSLRIISLNLVILIFLIILGCVGWFSYQLLFRKEQNQYLENFALLRTHLFLLAAACYIEYVLFIILGDFPPTPFIWQQQLVIFLLSMGFLVLYYLHWYSVRPIYTMVWNMKHLTNALTELVPWIIKNEQEYDYQSFPWTMLQKAGFSKEDVFYREWIAMKTHELQVKKFVKKHQKKLIAYLDDQIFNNGRITIPLKEIQGQFKDLSLVSTRYVISKLIHAQKIRGRIIKYKYRAWDSKEERIQVIQNYLLRKKKDILVQTRITVNKNKIIDENTKLAVILPIPLETLIKGILVKDYLDVFNVFLQKILLRHDLKDFTILTENSTSSHSKSFLVHMSSLKKVMMVMLKSHGAINLEELATTFQTSVKLMLSVTRKLVTSEKTFRHCMIRGNSLYSEKFMFLLITSKLKKDGIVFISDFFSNRFDNSAKDQFLEAIRRSLSQKNLNTQYWGTLGLVVINESVLKRRINKIIKHRMFTTIEELRNFLDFPKESNDYLVREVDSLLKEKPSLGIRVGDVISTISLDKLEKILFDQEQQWKDIQKRIESLAPRSTPTVEILEEIRFLRDQLLVLEEFFNFTGQNKSVQRVRELQIEIHRTLHSLNVFNLKSNEIVKSSPDDSD